MRSLAILIAAAAVFALAGCGDMLFRPPNTAVYSPGQPHSITENPPPGGTIRQCPITAQQC